MSTREQNEGRLTFDPDEVTVVKATVKQFVLENVPAWAASFITDEEETKLALAIVGAVETWRTAKEI